MANNYTLSNRKFIKRYKKENILSIFFHLKYG